MVIHIITTIIWAAAGCGNCMKNMGTGTLCRDADTSVSVPMCVASEQAVLILYCGAFHSFFVILCSDKDFVGIRILLHPDGALDDDRDAHHVDRDGKDRD